MKAKKILVGALSMAMVLSMAACGSGNDSTTLRLRRLFYHAAATTLRMLPRLQKRERPLRQEPRGGKQRFGY